MILLMRAILSSARIRFGAAFALLAWTTMATSVASAQGRQSRDGNWWLSLPIQGSPEAVARNYIIKSWYITGIMDGLPLLGTDLVVQAAVEAGDLAAAEKARGDWFRTIERYWGGRVTQDQIADGLESLYSDFRNRGIPVPAAVGIVLRQVAGVPQPQIESMLEGLRRNAAR